MYKKRLSTNVTNRRCCLLGLDTAIFPFLCKVRQCTQYQEWRRCFLGRMRPLTSNGDSADAAFLCKIRPCANGNSADVAFPYKIWPSTLCRSVGIALIRIPAVCQWVHCRALLREQVCSCLLCRMGLFNKRALPCRSEPNTQSS